MLDGTADHKVPAAIASRQRADGWLAVRPCFRGAGATQGQHDHGFGETEDMVAVVSRLDELFPDLPLVLIGFSFGAYVQTRVVRRMQELGRSPSGLALVGRGIGEVTGGRFYDTGSVPHDTLVIHGERDEHVPLANVLRWAEPQSLPVVTIPGADHTFGRRLPLLADVVASHLAPLAR